MYTVLYVILLAAALYLILLHVKFPLSRKLVLAEGICCGIGILSHPLLRLGLTLHTRSLNNDTAAWARDTVSTYHRYALPALAVFILLFIFTSLSPLWEKRYRTSGWYWVRSLCLFCSSAAILALSAFFAVMSQTDVLPLADYIRLWGFAGVFVLRGMYVMEYLWRHILQTRAGSM